MNFLMNISKQGHDWNGNVARPWRGPSFLFVQAQAFPLLFVSRTVGALACCLIQAELYRTKPLPLTGNMVPGHCVLPLCTFPFVICGNVCQVFNKSQPIQGSSLMLPTSICKNLICHRLLLKRSRIKVKCCLSI